MSQIVGQVHMAEIRTQLSEIAKLLLAKEHAERITCYYKIEKFVKDVQYFEREDPLEQEKLRQQVDGLLADVRPVLLFGSFNSLQVVHLIYLFEKDYKDTIKLVDAMPERNGLKWTNSNSKFNKVIQNFRYMLHLRKCFFLLKVIELRMYRLRYVFAALSCS